MRGIPASMKVFKAGSPAQALKLLADHPLAVPIAGGTDFMVAWNMGLLNEKSVLDLSGIREWTRVEETPSGLRAGALATHAELRDHPVVRRRFPLLAQACASVGSVQIQNRGTIGGNIANASPAGDTFPALAVYDARVSVAGRDGMRSIPFVDSFAGVKKTILGQAELISAVDIPFPSAKPDRQVFRKVGTRTSQAISKTVAAGLLWLGKGGIVKEMRFSLGSMAPTVRRLRAAEGYLAGRRLTPDVVDTAAQLLAKDVSPIDDFRSTAEYRLEVSRNILRSFLAPN
ncbi:MAG: xanthine dehydrogenase family protein subunit M [Elusimicrobia bacterium]|nr:xanthine dehydrogenase family protein subunit M [Elusimicrobiota bacterium]